MRYRIITVGKARQNSIAAAIEDFRLRLRRYAPLEEIEIPPCHGGDPARAVQEEGKRILAQIAAAELVWLLERGGTALSSTDLAQRLRAEEQNGVARLTLVIAGTYGADQALRRRAGFFWSLGPLTFLHEWARAIVLEQLYRAAKIARNEPYHH